MSDKPFSHASFLDHISAARVNLDVAERRYAELVAGPMDEARYEQLGEALIQAGISTAWASGRAADDLTAITALSGESIPFDVPAVLEAAMDVLPPEPEEDL